MLLSVLLSVLICELSLKGLSAAKTKDGCDDGWLLKDKHCYLIVSKEQVLDSSTLCRDTDSRLVSIWDEEEWTFLINNWPNNSSSQVYWTGFIRRYNHDTMSPGSWRWTDGSSTYNAFLSWLTPEDKTAKPTADYNCLGVGMASNGSHVTFNCSDVLNGYICKTARPFVYAMGEPWKETLGNRSERWEQQTALIQSTFFHIVADPRPVLSKPDSLQQKMGVDDVHCAGMCLADPKCVYTETYCQTHTKCAFFKCVLKEM